MSAPGSTRDRMLAGFADLLLEHGYRGLSLRAITDRIGVQRPALYHHFPDGKEQMFREVALALIAADAERVRAAIADHDRLEDQLLALALLHDDERRATLDLRIFEATGDVAEATRLEVSSRYVEDLLDPVSALMSRAVASGEVSDADPTLLMRVFLEMAKAVPPVPASGGLPADRRGPAPSQEEAARLIVAIFLRGASGEAHRRPAP